MSIHYSQYNTISPEKLLNKTMAFFKNLMNELLTTPNPGEQEVLIQSDHIILSKMSSFPQRTHREIGKYGSHTWGKKQPLETLPKETQTLNLQDKLSNEL